MDEVALAELVLDELVGGAGIRHAQQGFRQHHQRQALLGGKRELAKHVLDAAEPVVAGANGVDQARRGAVDPRVLLRAQAGGFEQPGRHATIVRRVGRRERRKGVRDRTSWHGPHDSRAPSCSRSRQCETASMMAALYFLA